MSYTSDIKSLVQDVATVFRITPVIDRVRVNNDSSFYLRIYYGADPPRLANDPGWHDTIGPGDHPLLFVVGASAEAFTNRNYVQSTPFLGVITIMPFLPTGGAVVGSGGVLFGASLCSITGYFPGELATPGNQVEAFIQAAKQNRVQALPIAILPRIVQTTDATANDFVLEDQVFTVGALVIAANQGASANTVVNIYWKGFLLDFESTTAATVAAAEFSYDLYITSNAGVTKFGPLQMYHGKVVADNGSKVFAFDHINGILNDPPWFQANFTPNQLASTDRIRIKLHNYASANQWKMYHHLYYVIDYNNQSLLPGIGGAPNPVAYSLTNPQQY